LNKNNLVQNAKLLIELIRPVFLPATIWVITAGIITTSQFKISYLPKILLTALTGQIAVFSINDYFDKDTDQENNRKGGIEGAIVNKNNKDKVKYISIISHLVLVIVALPLPKFALISGLILLTFSAIYSAPPLRLKTVPFLDSLCNIIILYSAFCIGVGIAGGGFNDVIPGAFWFAIAFGGPGHMIASYLDRESDKKAGIKTSGMILGRKGITLLGQTIILLMLTFEKWSPETKFILLYSFLGALYPAYTDKKIKKALYIWSIIPVIYIIVWIALRI
jgi:4-hydroxybenzoate polyprenyltransferase